MARPEGFEPPAYGFEVEPDRNPGQSSGYHGSQIAVALDAFLARGES